MKRLISIVLLLSISSINEARIIQNNAASPAFNSQLDQFINKYEGQRKELRQALKRPDLKTASIDQIASTIGNKKSILPVKKAHDTVIKAFRIVKTKGKDGIANSQTTINNNIETTRKRIDSLRETGKKYEELARRHKNSSYMCKIGDIESEVRGFERAVELLKNTREVELNQLKAIED